MRLTLPCVLVVLLAGCMAEPRSTAPLGVNTRILCEPSTALDSSARYPRVALSDTSAFVETTFGVTEHKLTSKANEGTKVRYTWSTGGVELVELEIDANGRGLMFAADPQMYDEQNMQRKAMYFAAVIGSGTHLVCKKVS